MSPAVDELRRAKQRVASAQHELVRVFKVSFPPGATVTWLKGNRRGTGVVLRHCFGDRLHARNNKTGGQVTVLASDIIRAGER